MRRNALYFFVFPSVYRNIYQNRILNTSRNQSRFYSYYHSLCGFHRPHHILGNRDIPYTITIDIFCYDVTNTEAYNKIYLKIDYKYYIINDSI